MKQPNRDRPLPPVYSFILKTEWMRRFTWKERLAIIFGSPLVVMIGIATRHNPGQHQPLIMGKVSKALTPDAHMRNVINNMIVRQDKEIQKP
jgi:hypothetical protein